MGNSILICDNISSEIIANSAANANIKPISICRVVALLSSDFTSAFIDCDLASLISELVGENITCSHIANHPTEDFIVILAQYVGPKLQKKCTSIPEEGKINFFEVCE